MLQLLIVTCFTLAACRAEEASSAIIFGDQDGVKYCSTLDGQGGVCMSDRLCWATKENPQKNGSDTLNTCGFLLDESQICCPAGKDTNDGNFVPELNSFENSTVDSIDESNSTNEDEVQSRQGIFRPVFLSPSCGRYTFNDDLATLRIAGGQRSPRGSWPWLARLGYYNGSHINYLCSGVLISKQHVLTAAHCVYFRRDLVFVRLGEHGISGFGPQDYYVENVLVHEAYVPNVRGPRNDLAIVRLADYAQFSVDIQPICVPIHPSLRNLHQLNTLPYVAGWGSQSYFEPPTNTLRHVQIPVVPAAKCADAYRSFQQLIIDNSVLCAGSTGRDACRGDSGSPLMIQYGNRFYVIGIVSFGVRCAQPGFPGVYTRISHYADWILRNLI